MKPLLLAALLGALAPSLFAAKRRARHAVPPAFPSDTFNAMCDWMIVQEGKAFIDPADKEDSPDPADLEQLRKNLSGAQLKAVDDKINAVKLAIREAEYVRDGCAPEDCPPDSKTYEEMVHRVTRRLFANDQLVSMQKRYQQADAKYLGTDVRPNRPRKRDGIEEDALAPQARSALLQEIALSRPKLGKNDAELQRKMAAARQALDAAKADPGPAPGESMMPVTRRTRQGAFRYTDVVPVRDIGKGAPTPPQPAPQVSEAGIMGDATAGSSRWSLRSLELGMMAKLGHIAHNMATVGDIGKCFRWVKKELIAAGIMKEYPSCASAADFPQLIEQNPKIFARKLKKLNPPVWPLPVGTTVVWQRGACGYSEDDGHIEIIYRVSPPIACSDLCEYFRTNCLAQLAPQGKVSAYVVEAEPGK